MDLENSNTKKTTYHSVYKPYVQVGRDTIEDVEYLIFEHSGWFEKKEIKTCKDLLEKIWDAITTTFYRIKHKVRDIYWKIRYGFQRMFKGYDVVDTFETFAKFIERYSKILNDYKKHHWGYPGGDITEEAWESIIDEMLYHLKYMDQETVILELEKDVPDDWSVSVKNTYEIMDKHKDAFFELFGKYFYYLWD